MQASGFLREEDVVRRVYQGRQRKRERLCVYYILLYRRLGGEQQWGMSRDGGQVSVAPISAGVATFSTCGIAILG